MRYTDLDWQKLPARAIQDDSAISADWNKLNFERHNLPFMTSTAICAALESFGTGSEKILIAKHAGRTVAIFIVVSIGKLQWRTFQPSQLPLGAWVAKENLILKNLAQSILHGPLKYSLAFSVTQVDPLLAPREGDESTSKTIDYIETGWIETSDSFEEYWEARGKNLRQNMRKQRNKLASENTNPVMRVLDGSSDIENGIQEYGLLESAGWKLAEGTAIHLENSQGKFYKTLLRSAAAFGNARIYQFLFNDKVVAVNLCIQNKDTLVVLKTTYDESIKQYSPAFLLNQDQLELIFKQKIIKRVEFYGKMMEWHTRWTDKKRTLYHLTCYRSSLIKKFALYVQKRNEKTQQNPSSPPQEELS